MWCCFICSAAVMLCVVRNCTVAVFLIFSLANGLCIVYSRWPCTFCIDIHEVDSLLSAWAKSLLAVCVCVACLFMSQLYICVCERGTSWSRYLCLHSGLLSRARLSLGQGEGMSFNLCICFPLMSHMFVLFVYFYPLWLWKIIKNKRLFDRLCQPLQPRAQHLSYCLKEIQPGS